MVFLPFSIFPISDFKGFNLKFVLLYKPNFTVPVSEDTFKTVAIIVLFYAKITFVIETIIMTIRDTKIFILFFFMIIDDSKMRQFSFF